MFDAHLTNMTFLHMACDLIGDDSGGIWEGTGGEEKGIACIKAWGEKSVLG